MPGSRDATPCFDPDAPSTAGAEHADARAGGARLDLFAAELADYAYPRHMHDTYVVALGRGAPYALECGRKIHVVPPGALVRPKNPLEYFRKLRFHQMTASVRDYGLLTEGARA